MGIFIGTSGYMYPHWENGIFYPKDVKEKDFLPFYAEFFNTVEINNSFYHLPTLENFSHWRNITPKGFHFSVKGSRYITQMKKLKDPKEPVNLFFDNAKGLSEKLAVVLWQFPASFGANAQRLEDFCKVLISNKYASKVRHAFEFRHDSWFADEIHSILGSYNFAVCIADSPVWPKDETITANYIYLRFHGGRSLYGSRYSKKELVKWAKKIKEWHTNGLDVYGYFNNDAYGFAPKNAKDLTGLF